MSAKKIVDALHALRGVVPSIVDLTAGTNFSARSKGYDLGLVVRFKDPKGLEDYAIHPAHQKFVNELVKPLTSDVLAVDYEF